MALPAVRRVAPAVARAIRPAIGRARLGVGQRHVAQEARLLLVVERGIEFLQRRLDGGKGWQAWLRWAHLAEPEPAVKAATKVQSGKRCAFARRSFRGIETPI